MGTILSDLKASGKKKWIFAFPVLLVILLIWCMEFSGGVVRQLQVEDKYVEIVDIIDIISIAINVAYESPDDFGHHGLKSAIEYIDSTALPFAQCAIYKLVDGRFVPQSATDAEAAGFYFDINGHADLAEAAKGSDSGKLTIQVGSGSTGEPMSLYTYFRWAPMSWEPGQRFLIFGAVAESNVSTDMPAVLNLSYWAMLLATVLCTVALVYAIVRQCLRMDKVKAIYLELSEKRGV